MKKERRKFGTIYYVRRKQELKDRKCGYLERDRLFLTYMAKSKFEIKI
jgi:hypothetical protein